MSALDPNNMVMLELSRRNEIGDDAIINRISLHVESVNIMTTKTVPNMGIPLSGAVRGESLNLAFDMGLSSKTMSLGGTLVEQTIKKQSGTADAKNVVMTSFELAQLIHSYVDSSSLQDDQNISKLLFFYPSKVDNTFSQRTKNEAGDTVTEEEMKVLDLDKVPIIPFSWKNRAYDNDFTLGTGNKMDNESTIFDDASLSDNHTGVTGFVRSFTTNIIATEFPSIGFTLDFEEAKVIGDNFFD